MSHFRECASEVSLYDGAADSRAHHYGATRSSCELLDYYGIKIHNKDLSTNINKPGTSSTEQG